MAKKNGLPWEVMICYGIVRDSMEIFRNYMKKRDKSTNRKLMDKTYGRAISVKLTIILKQTQGPKSKHRLRHYFYLINEQHA